MPITDRNQAKEGGFAQVREALTKFKGRVTSAEFGMWGGELVDDQGKKKQPREFLEITTEDNVVLASTEELSMDITQNFSHRQNCSDYKGSFWVDMFLASADQFKVRIPDGLINKVVTFEKKTLEAVDKNGKPNPKFNSTNFIIVGVEDAKIATTTESAKVQTQQEAADWMSKAANLAVGKTEAQFRTSIALDPAFVNNPLLSLAKAGLLTQSLMADGKLVLVDGKYQKPA
jgi:hypothetical protein